MILGVIASYSQNQTYTTSSEEEHLWGPISNDALTQAPYAEWYEESIKDYYPDNDIQMGVSNLEKMNVTIYLGTWCGDSKNWVPKFISLWNSLGLDTEHISLVGLHGGRAHYKQGPEAEEKGAHIHRVPTFIFEKNGSEVGRIVERPLNSLELDIAQLAAGIPSEPRYQAVSYMIDFYENHEIEQFDHEIDQIIDDTDRINSGIYELNTYGSVLQSAGEFEKAQQIFKLNQKMYPYEPRSHYSLGVSHMGKEEWNDAKDCFIEALKINPKDPYAVKRLHDTNEKLKS